MPADYAKIRDENIARYGWDTAVLDLLGHLYSERTHFIYELIQNAEDAGATEPVMCIERGSAGPVRAPIRVCTRTHGSNGEPSSRTQQAYRWIGMVG